MPLQDVPHVTVIRPIEGLDTRIYECLASTFHQDYPPSKLTVHFCISSRSSPAFPVLEQLLQDFPDRDARVLVEEEDPVLIGQDTSGFQLGPNPKIRNMSRGYREAKGDLVWIIDCNVWIGYGACGRMVDKLCGFSNGVHGKPYKFVHHLPIVVDVGVNFAREERAGLLHGDTDHSIASGTDNDQGTGLEELFLSSSHAKFYTAINAVAIAPCIVGKSNMFRRSHLDHLTTPYSLTARQPTTDTTIRQTPLGTGIDYFSSDICEDHLIGDLLWRSTLPSSLAPPSIGNHALVATDLAIQPLDSMSLNSYIARRVRWLRVRKFTVTLATLVEPGTESFLCSLYAAFAVTTLPFFRNRAGVPPTWTAFAIFWLLSVMAWAAVDWFVYRLLHSGRTVSSVTVAAGSSDDRSSPPPPPPAFALGRGRHRGLPRRKFVDWVTAWLGREALALPIWLWAFWGGTTVRWRDRRFWVGMDMRVHEIEEKDAEREEQVHGRNMEWGRGRGNGKGRKGRRGD